MFFCVRGFLKKLDMCMRLADAIFKQYSSDGDRITLTEYQSWVEVKKSERDLPCDTTRPHTGCWAFERGRGNSLFFNDSHNSFEKLVGFFHSRETPSFRVHCVLCGGGGGEYVCSARRSLENPAPP